MTFTNNHNYDKLAHGERRWDKPINANLDSLDVDVEIRDVDANKGNYEPLNGAKYLSTDTADIYLGDGSSWNLLATIGSGGGGASDFEGLDDVSSGILANRPAAGTVGDWYFTTDNNGVYYDDGTNWQLIAEHPANISAGDLGFDPATQTELNSHEGTASAHHQEPSAGSGITDEGTNQFGLDSVANGDATLSGSSTTVDTGHAINDTAEYMVMANPDEGADLAFSLEEGATNYIIHIEENTTSVGNPSCRWRLVRYN